MPRHTTPLALLIAAGSLWLTGLPASASDAVTDALQASYAPYRVALFRTNSKAQAESVQAMADARAAWSAVRQRYAGAPPVPYDRDAAFTTTLAKVDEIYAKAATQVAASQLAEAHETLEAVRDQMADLRKRNGVVVYSDHMNAFHVEMEHVLIDGPRTLSQPGGLIALAGQAGVLGYLSQRLADEAPAVLARDAEFGPALQAVQASVAALRGAVARQDEAAVREAIGKLKGPYSRLFLKFG